MAQSGLRQGKKISPAPGPAKATKGRSPTKPAPAAAPKALANQVSAAAPITELSTGWKEFKFGSSNWQTEAWRHYDRCPELHNAAGQIAVGASRCILYIAEKVDGEAGKRSDDPALVELSDQILGGADERPELIRLAIINDFVAGEYYTFIETPEDATARKAATRGRTQTAAAKAVAKPSAKPNETIDRWMVFSVTQVKKASGAALEFERPAKHGGGKIIYQLPEGKDSDAERLSRNTGILTRCWQQHGQAPDHADSSVRAALPVLLVIEQFDKRQSAQNDSRLAGAGVMFLPDSFDFPHEEDQQPTDAFEAKLGDAMGQTLKDPANARSLVPVMAASLPAEDIDKVRWMTFETPLDESTMSRLDQCIRRLALGLDLPPEMMLGLAGVNHWTGWLSEASTQKLFIAPPLARLCNAITEGWLQPMLASMGKDPQQYMVWFDMSPLTVRPDRQADALQMWDRGLINDEAARRAGNWPETDAHTPESFARWLMIRAAGQNGAMLADPSAAAAIGIKPVAAAGGQTAIESGAANQQPPAQRTSAQEALVAGAEMAALHSLGVAGKKMLTRGVRDDLLHEFGGQPFNLHTRLSVNDIDHALRLLENTWDLLPALAARTGTHFRILRDTLAFYCASQMSAGMPHNPDTLTFFLAQGVEAAGHRWCTPEACTNQLNPQPCGVARVAVNA